jgi:hypothetical protein
MREHGQTWSDQGMKNTTLVRLATSFIAGAMLLGACGGSTDSATEGDDSSGQVTAAAEASGATPETTPTEAGDADGTETATATDSGAVSGGPEGVDISQAPLCALVSAEAAKTLFGDLKIANPSPDPRSCGLFATPEGVAFGASLLIQPMFAQFDDNVKTSKELGYTVEELTGIGEKAVFISGTVPGFAPSADVVFLKDQTTYHVMVSFGGGVPAVDPQTVKSITVPIATEYAKMLPLP